MKVRLAYGSKGLEIELPDDRHVTLVEPGYTPALSGTDHALQQALRRPIGSPPLQELVQTTNKVGIIMWLSKYPE